SLATTKAANHSCGLPPLTRSSPSSTDFVNESVEQDTSRSRHASVAACERAETTLIAPDGYRSKIDAPKKAPAIAAGV
ncbi:hypothetical protein, partial [Ralstonia pseudosolanacearum]